jgi:aconitate hydratase
MPIFDASQLYLSGNTPLVVLGGKENRAGSSRPRAAKGPMLLGVKAVIAETYERIHRSNLVGMGILPLQFMPGQNAQTLGLKGAETFDILGVAEGFKPRKELVVRAAAKGGKPVEFKVLARVDTAIELEYYRYGGILRFVLSQMLSGSGKGKPVAA